VPNRKSKIENPKLLAWYQASRRDLPWRRTRDPYAILVSEFMAQQTTVAAVVPYYERWMREFPTVAALAAADEQEVLAAWQGLGYYSRARNFHKAAQVIMERFGGGVPDTLEALESLPGIGAYTAGAVMAFAYDRPAPVVDANVARVLARLHDLREPIDTTRGKALLREAALALQPEEGGACELNSALMELGALVCKPRDPLCGACPIRGACRTSDPEALPMKRPRQAVTTVTERRAFIMENGYLHLVSSTGRWKGMWILPEVETNGHSPAHIEIYPITRYRVHMEVVRMDAGLMKDLHAFPTDSLDGVPIPSPHRRAIRALLAAG
jgi:A/G-specific adenine glycosylase